MPKRVDANQKEIAAALRKVGATVLHLHEVGHGCPDLAVGFRGVNFLFEVKDGSKSASQRRLTPDEQRFHDLWRGHVQVVSTITEAIEAIGAS